MGEQAASRELVEAATFAANVLAELYAKYSTKVGPFASQAQKANGMLRAALKSASTGHEPLSGEALLAHLEGQCQAVWRTSFTIVCTLPKGHDGDHRADCGYTFNGEVDARAAQPPVLSLDERIQRFPQRGWRIEIACPFSYQAEAGERYPITFKATHMVDYSTGNVKETEALDLAGAVAWLEQRLGITKPGDAP